MKFSVHHYHLLLIIMFLIVNQANEVSINQSLSCPLQRSSVLTVTPTLKWQMMSLPAELLINQCQNLLQ